MGTEFSWFYDVMLVAIVIGMVFLGVKRGFVRMLLSLLSVAIAFVAALTVSGSVSSWVYESFVEQNLQTSITDTINDAVGENVVTQLAQIDMDKAVIGGMSLSSVNESLKVDDAGKITLDLSNIDLSETGIKDIDLTSIGFEQGIDYSSINIGKIQVYEATVKEQGLGNAILAQIVSEKIMSSSLGDAFKDVVKNVSEVLPFLGLNENIDNSLLSDLVVSVIESGGNPGQSVLDNIVKPIVVIPMRTIIFLILFILISVLLSFIIKSTSLINKIPIIGTLNELLGGVMGLVQGVVIVFVVVIILNSIITLTENSLIFLNEATIDKSFAFSWIYHFNFLDFLK